MAKKRKGRGRGWHGDSAGHSQAARKGGKIAGSGKKARKKVSKKSFRKKQFEKKRRIHESKLKKVRKKHGKNLPSHVEKDLMKYF